MASQPDPTDPFHPSDPSDRAEIPGLPYVHGRDLVPLRSKPQTIPNPRLQRLLRQEDELRRTIRALDQELLDLAARRQKLLEQVKHIHNEIRPIHNAWCGRRRRPIAHEPLPPTAAKPTLVIGRELRALCLVFLRQAARPLTLRHLHAQLHRAGYAIAHRYPAKALADALGHEADQHRCTRLKRGVYSAPQYAAADPHDDVALPDW